MDSEIQSLYQQLQLEALRDYLGSRRSLNKTQRQTLLAEMMAGIRGASELKSGASYPFFSASAIAASLADGELANLHAQSS